MVMSDNWGYEVLEVDARHEISADARVHLHPFELGGCQLARLVQDVLWNTNLPDVVQQSSSFDRLDERLIFDAKVASQADRVSLDSADVSVSDLVFRVDSHRKRLDGRDVKLIQF